jgi:SSS family solute:Na+ symporter
MLFYPLICTVVFFMPISVGVLGRLSFPDLAGKEADRILPMVMTLISGDVMAALVLAAGLAALMSTMDSQLLTLSSIFTHDIAPLVQKKKSSNSLTGRIFVIFLSLAGLMLAYKPPATILQIATQTFTGLAVLFPTVFFGLYLKRVFALSGIFSIICGETALVFFYFKWIPAGDFLPVVWVMIITFSVYLMTHFALLLKEKAFQISLPAPFYSPYMYLLAGIFILSMDFWAWGKSRPLIIGIPLWMGYFIVLSAAQTVVMLVWVRTALKTF